MNKQYCVYIMTNYTNSTLYTGVSGNLRKRIEDHKKKSKEGFTKKYHVWKLVYYETYEDPKMAIKREKQIKNLVGRKKEDLIKSINPEFEEIKLDKVIIL